MAEGRGFVLAPKERWNFADNQVCFVFGCLVRIDCEQLECIEGVYKVTYNWDGANFTLVDSSKCHGGYGHYQNGTWKWFFPLESKDKPFWEFKKQQNKMVCTSIQYKSPLTWEEKQEEGDNRKVTKVDGGKDHPRGHSGDEWELGGSVPSELAFFGVMFSRSQILMETLIERRKRNYQRCNAFTPNESVKPMICINCAEGDLCICCSERHGGYSGRFCKACAPRRVSDRL